MKLLRPRRIRLTIVHNPTRLYQDVRVSTRSCPVLASATPNLNLFSNPTQYVNSLNIVKTATDISQHLKINSSLNKKAVTTKFVCAEPRPVRITNTSEGEDKLRKFYGKVVSKGTLQDHQVHEQAPKGECKTLNRDDNANATSIVDVKHNIDLQSKVMYQRRLQKENIGTTLQLAINVHMSRPMREI